MPTRIKVEKGDKYGRWTVIKEAKKKNYTRMALCKCDCGSIKKVRLSNLRSGKSKSCGCYKKELLTKHGAGHNRLYKIWSDIKQRCFNDNKKCYKNYGGRGIKICDEWMDFKNFQKWAKENGYSDNLTIDRIDVDGDYTPDNCRWATKKEQSINRREKFFVKYKGKKRRLIKLVEDLPDSLNLNYNAVFNRIYRGWEVKRALETPLQEKF